MTLMSTDAAGDTGPDDWLDLDYLYKHGRLSLADAKGLHRSLCQQAGMVDEAAIAEDWGSDDKVYEMTVLVLCYLDQKVEEVRARRAEAEKRTGES